MRQWIVACSLLAAVLATITVVSRGTPADVGSEVAPEPDEPARVVRWEMGSGGETLADVRRTLPPGQYLRCVPITEFEANLRCEVRHGSTQIARFYVHDPSAPGTGTQPPRPAALADAVPVVDREPDPCEIPASAMRDWSAERITATMQACADRTGYTEDPVDHAAGMIACRTGLREAVRLLYGDGYLFRFTDNALDVMFTDTRVSGNVATYSGRAVEMQDEDGRWIPTITRRLTGRRAPILLYPLGAVGQGGSG